MSDKNIETNEKNETNEENQNETIPTVAQEPTLSPKELLIEEIKPVRFDSELFESFKGLDTYFFGIDYTCDMSDFTIVWVSSKARDAFLEFYQSNKE